MKLDPNNFNPLRLIVELFPHKIPKGITVAQSEAFVQYLKLGGIECTSELEELEAFKLLGKLGLLEVELETNITGTTLKVGNKYNGK